MARIYSFHCLEALVSIDISTSSSCVHSLPTAVEAAWASLSIVGVRHLRDDQGWKFLADRTGLCVVDTALVRGVIEAIKKNSGANRPLSTRQSTGKLPCRCA
jgi:hypothetical protein